MLKNISLVTDNFFWVFQQNFCVIFLFFPHLVRWHVRTEMEISASYSMELDRNGEVCTTANVRQVEMELAALI